MWGLLRRDGAAQRQLLAMIGNFLRSVYKPHSAPSMGVLSSQSGFLRSVYKPHIALSMGVLSSQSGFLRSVYKPHSVQRIAPPVQPSLWTTRYRVVRAAYPGLALSTVGGRTCGDEQSPIVHRRFRPCLALLPAGVTWPAALLRPPVVFYTTFSPSPPPPSYKSCDLREVPVRAQGVSCLFLWPSSGRLAPCGGFPAPGAIRRRALWSADFPRPRQRRAAIARPT